MKTYLFLLHGVPTSFLTFKEHISQKRCIFNPMLVKFSELCTLGNSKIEVEHPVSREREINFLKCYIQGRHTKL